MRYFDKSFTDFFLGLQANNHKEWFEAHRSVYEKSVKKPFQKLVEDVIAKVEEFDPHVPISPAKAIFRINRDIRFSKDKTPYKTHVAASITPHSKNSDTVGYYFSLSPKGLELGGGIYMPDKTTLDKIRSEIHYHTEEFSMLVSEKSFKVKFGTLLGEQNKIIPSQYKETFAIQPLIANKQFYYWAEYDSPDMATRSDLLEFIVEHFRIGAPINEFLHRAIST